MSSTNIDHLRYPIGKFSMPADPDHATIAQWIKEIQSLPQRLKQTLSTFTPAELAQTYRPDGWTAAQLVHHLLDSHLNAYIRTKLALTEENPTVKPYEEGLWAELPDAKDTDISSSLLMLEAMHKRWSDVLLSLNETERARTYFHPESKKTFPINYLIGMYAWHGNHHHAHINLCKK